MDFFKSTGTRSGQRPRPRCNEGSNNGVSFASTLRLYNCASATSGRINYEMLSTSGKIGRQACGKKILEFDTDLYDLEVDFGVAQVCYSCSSIRKYHRVSTFRYFME